MRSYGRKKLSENRSVLVPLLLLRGAELGIGLDGLLRHRLEGSRSTPFEASDNVMRETEDERDGDG